MARDTASGPSPSSEAERGSSAALAAAIVSFEAEFAARRPDSVVLADDSDAALAAALVATKLGIPVAAARGRKRTRTRQRPADRPARRTPTLKRR